MPEPSSSPFSYLILRLVPSMERGEQINVGVVVFCRQRRFLGARVSLDAGRLGAIAPGIGAEQIAELADHLTSLVRIAEGAADAGPIAALDQSERFGWLAAPSSTVIQASQVHTGLCSDPDTTLDTLFARLVAPAAAV